MLKGGMMEILHYVLEGISLLNLVITFVWTVQDRPKGEHQRRKRYRRGQRK